MRCIVVLWVNGPVWPPLTITLPSVVSVIAVWVTLPELSIANIKLFDAAAGTPMRNAGAVVVLCPANNNAGALALEINDAADAAPLPVIDNPVCAAAGLTVKLPVTTVLPVVFPILLAQCHPCLILCPLIRLY